MRWASPSGSGPFPRHQAAPSPARCRYAVSATSVEDLHGDTSLMEHWLPSDHLCGKYAMSRWRYLRWWLAAFVVSLLSFLSLWLPALFEGDGAVGCAGYGPLPSGLTRLWSVLEVMWLDVRQEIAGTHGRYLVLNGVRGSEFSGLDPNETISCRDSVIEPFL